MLGGETMNMDMDTVLIAEDDLNNPKEKLELKEYIRALGDHLLCEPEFDNERLYTALDSLQMDIQEIRNHFNTDAPPGLEVVRDFMLESLELYHQSIDDMKVYIDSRDRDILSMAVLKSEEAEDIIEAIDQVIQEHRDRINTSREY